jgi:hypothetical protein
MRQAETSILPRYDDLTHQQRLAYSFIRWPKKIETVLLLAGNELLSPTKRALGCGFSIDDYRTALAVYLSQLADKIRALEELQG